MKMKNKLHYLMMALIVAAITAGTWSCNKDDDPSLADLRQDKLQYLEDSLRISDSLKRINAAGIVNYAVVITNGSTSTLNKGGYVGRTNDTKSSVEGAIVTISQYGKIAKDTTDASGMVVFKGFFRTAVNVTVERPNFTTASFLIVTSVKDSTVNNSITFIGSILPIFETTGANTSTISGRATIQTNLTNTTRELAPDGTTVTANIDAKSSNFESRFLTYDVENIYTPSCGCDMLTTAEIIEASYSTNGIGTVTGGNYSITVPSAIDGLPMVLEYSDIAADQTLFESTGGSGQRTIVRRAIFSRGVPGEVLPTSSSVNIGFETFSVSAAATAIITGGTGALDRIEVTAGGTGYTVAPIVDIQSASGSGATATATVANGVVTGITLTNPGSGYIAPPTIVLRAGNGATATAALAVDGTVTGVAVSNSGSGYVTAPTVTFSAPGGTGTLATGTANIDAAGRVTSVTITAAGSGYTANPTVTFSAAPAGGTTATGSGIFSGNSVGAVTITAPGSYYVAATPPTVAFSLPQRANGVRATGTTTVDASTGQVTGIVITNPGSGYTAVPTVTISSATGAGATASLVASAVTLVNVTNQGADYTGTPIVTFSGGGGSGATGTAVMAGGKVVGVTVTNGGKGYTAAPSVAFSAGDNANAYATVTNGAISAITITDGGRNFTGAPRVTITSGDGGGATATATVTGGQITGVTVTAGGTGYLEGNTPSVKEDFSSTKSSLETKTAIKYINDIHYGTGVRQPN